VIVEQCLALDSPVSSYLVVVYTNRELAAVRLRLSLNSLSVFFGKLVCISSSFLVVDAL
jgi:hypothetical protein